MIPNTTTSSYSITNTVLPSNTVLLILYFIDPNSEVCLLQLLRYIHNVLIWGKAGCGVLMF